MTKTNYSTQWKQDGDVIVSYNQVLDPRETEISVQGYLGQLKYIDTPNPYGEFVFTFFPYTTDDEQRLLEHIENWKFKLEYELLMNPFADVEVKSHYQGGGGAFVCNQLFAPKLNVDIPYEDFKMTLQNKEASFKLHLRNTVDAGLYLMCDYVDVFDTNNGVTDVAPEEAVTNVCQRIDDF